MRSGIWMLVLSLVGCARAAPPVGPGEAGEPVEASPTVDGSVVTAAPARPDPVAPKPEPEPPKVLHFVGDGWVRDRDAPDGPLVRFWTLRPSAEDEPAAIRALIDVLEPLMTCYEAELGEDPELRATLWVRRRQAEPTDPEGMELEVNAPHPTGLEACAGSVLRAGLPTADVDPRGRYELRMFPRRDRAPRLRQPEPDDQVIEREGGSCWTRQTYPCKPKKICKAADWQRTRCHHPADDPAVALRWVFDERAEDWWEIVGLDLVAADGSTVWRTPLKPEDTERLGPMARVEVQRHDAEFRDRDLPRVWWVAVERERVIVADRAGVRVYDRRTGTPRFRHAPRGHDALRMWFDAGTFVARKGKRRCEGEARSGAFAARCGDDLFYFDGYALAVVAVDGSVWLREQVTLDDPGSKRNDETVRPTASLKAAGYRVKIEGMIYME